MTRLLIFLLFLTTQNVFSVNQNSSTGVNSVLASGRWVKAGTYQSGIHKITFAALKTMGFQSPQSVKIYGTLPGMLPPMNHSPSPDDLLPYRTWQTKDKLANDCFLFYVPGNVTWELDPASKSYIHKINAFAQGRTFLYLTEDAANSSGQAVLAGNLRTENPSFIVTGFDDFAFFEEEEYNLLETGSRWFSKLIIPNTSFQKTFIFPDRQINEPVKISISAAGRSEYASSLNLSVNSATAATLNFSPYSNFTEADYADLAVGEFSKTFDSADLNFSLHYNAPANGKCWLDFIRIQTRRKLNMQGDQLNFCDSRTVGAGIISEFRVGNAVAGLKIWEITSPLRPIEIQTSTANNLLSFKTLTDSLRRFIAFNPLSDFPAVEKIEEVKNQNLHGLSVPDMILVTTAEYLSEASRLAQFHRQTSGLGIALIDVAQIYNEFSGGIADVTAIRNFVRYLYRKSLNNNSSKLKYLLLFGKGTYDNFHPVTAENPCFIPTWQSESSLNPASSFVSDDYFGLLDENEGGQNGIVDIGIGRIPCVTLAEAKIATDKIIHYDNAATMGEWRNVVCFVGDDEDNNIHVSDSEQLANFVNRNYPAFYTDKIYLDAFKEESTPEKRYPEVNKAFSNRVKEGALIINYVGHANEEGLAHEKILTIPDIDSWSNTGKLPVLVTATCEFSRWDMKSKQSAGEHVLFNKVGGGVALFSTTRLVYSSSNFEMNKSFFRYVFEADPNGNNLRMGDIIRLAKSELGGSVNSSKFALLGDPALQINYPRFKVKTLEINNQPVEQLTDTLKPLSLVSVWGEIQNLKGEKLTGYNGVLFPSVYDKLTMVSTLGNGGQTPFSYSQQNSLLYKGNVSVKSGEFTYSFKIPKEISYRIGNGIIRNYSQSADNDAGGSFGGLKLGGSPVAAANDITGPVISLFLDDENFKTGGQVSKAPLLIAYLEDESGINTSGSGIGHDITAYIDKQSDKLLTLNDYFESEKDSYKKGKVLFQLPDLMVGEHTLTFKAWDMANNSSETVLKFTVATGLNIKKVSSFPNPATEYTDIVAEHNRYGEKMLVEIEIFTQQGVLADQIKTDSGSEGFNTQPIRWNPGSNGRLASGVYYYRVRLTAPDGAFMVKTGQLILKR